VDEDSHYLSADVRPARRLIRLAQDFLCAIVADGLPLEGRTLNLNEQGLAIALPEPVFADLDCVQVILTAHDGSLFHLTGRVVRQHQATIGEVVVGIQLAKLSVEATTNLIEKCAPHSPFTMEANPFRYPEPSGLRGWMHALIGQPPIPPPDSHRLCDSPAGDDTQRLDPGSVLFGTGGTVSQLLPWSALGRNPAGEMRQTEGPARQH
jgi:hypothetical protein